MAHTNPTRRTKLEDLALVQRDLRERESLPKPEQIQRRLRELQAFVRLLESTDAGKGELARRQVRYGDCVRQAYESDGDYYSRLRTWLDGEF